ncbi:MAG TPA: DsbA family protein [Solirubrobacteraceae bacterium]|nr:DsbA family protein [Solirubrobacteraceae bacterium]
MSVAPASFYFDLSSPLAYLAAERILHTLPGPCEWQPVLARELDRDGPDVGLDRETESDREGRAGAPVEAWRCEQEREAFREDIALGARELGLQALRWPEPFPFDSALAMRVATYAKSIGRTVPFAQAAFRQVFAGGRDLSQLDNVLIAAAACEMHPAAVARGAELRSVAEQLAAATRDAANLGIIEIPAILVGEEVFAGERAVEQAAVRMRELGPADDPADADASVGAAP